MTNNYRNLTAVVFLLTCYQASANSYLIVNYGESRLRGNGDWHNWSPATSIGYSSTDNETSNTYSIGVGKRYGWGSVELSYQDFGDSSSYAGYPYDPGFGGCDPAAWPCNLNTQWVYHYGEARGINLSVLPEWKIGRVGLFSRLCASYYEASFTYKIANERGVPNARQFDYEGGWTSSGISPCFGLGIRVGDYTLETTRYHSIEAIRDSEGSDSEMRGHFKTIDTITIGIRKDF